MRDPDKGSNIIRNAALPYMMDPGQAEGKKHDPEAKALIYGYIEANNIRSMNFSEQMGAETIRKFTTLIFTRISLRKRLNIERIEKDEINSFLPELKNFYKEYSFFTTQNMFFDGNYFVYREDDQIQIGMQVHPEAWKIVDLAGKHNKIVLKLLPSLPYVRSIFNPKDFRFLALEGIFYRPGKESLLEPFLESVCKHFKTHFALTWVDSASGLAADMLMNIDFGIIGKSFDSFDVHVRMRFNNYKDD